MKATNGILTGHEHIFTPWPQNGVWTKRLLNKETVTELITIAASLGMVGFLEFALYRAMETWTITGSAISVAGYF